MHRPLAWASIPAAAETTATGDSRSVGGPLGRSHGDKAEELANGDDLQAAKAGIIPYREEVIVPGDEVIGSPTQRARQHHLVLGVPNREGDAQARSDADR